MSERDDLIQVLMLEGIDEEIAEDAIANIGQIADGW